MSNQLVIDNTIEFVKTTLAEAEGGHDWWHIYRVWQLSRNLAGLEQVDLFVVELGALLHDIADSKFHGGDETVGPALASDFLTNQRVDEGIINQT